MTSRSESLSFLFFAWFEVFDVEQERTSRQQNLLERAGIWREVDLKAVGLHAPEPDLSAE